MDCLGLNEQMKLQLQANTRCKWASNKLVLPLKKMPRLEDESASSQSCRKGKEKEIVISTHHHQCRFNLVTLYFANLLPSLLTLTLLVHPRQ
jgi:hypothetical protein